MFLRSHQPERGEFLLPHWSDVEQDIMVKAALLRLVRFEEKHGRRPEHRYRWLMPMCLRDDPRFLGRVRYQGVIEVIRVLERVRQDEFRTQLPKQIGQSI